MTTPFLPFICWRMCGSDSTVRASSGSSASRARSSGSRPQLLRRLRTLSCDTTELLAEEEDVEDEYES